MVLNGRQCVDDRLVFGNLAIEHPKRIRLRAPLAIFAEARRNIAEPFLQQRDILGPAVLVAHRVQIKLESGQPNPAKQFHHHFDHFGIDSG